MSEDVLERALSFRARFAAGGPWPNDGRDAEPLIADLAAALREARKDTERLDWLGDAGVSIHANTLCYAIHDSASRDFLGEGETFREAIDAAAASAKGE